MSRIKAAMLVLLASVLGCVASIDEREETASTSQALGTPFWGYAWFSHVSSTAPIGFQQTSTGGTIVGRKRSTGVFEIDFSFGAPLKGNAQVVAYGGNAHCKPEAWFGVGIPLSLRIRVLCFSPSGAPVDSSFVVSYIQDTRIPLGSDNIRAAYLWHSNGSSTPENEAQLHWSSMGGGYAVTKPSTGEYRVVLGGMATPAVGTRQIAIVSAFGPTDTYCTVERWGNVGSPEEPSVDKYIDVRCFDGAGTPADSMFSLRFWTLGHYNSNEGAYVRDESPLLTTYVPTAPYFHANGLTGSISVSRIGVGAWSVNFPGATFNKSGALAHPIAANGNYCNIQSWSPGAFVNVRCFNPAGTLTDTSFTAAYLDGAAGP